MRRGENMQQAAAPLNNYQFDFELGPGLSKPRSSGSLRDQKKQPTSSSSHASAGWSASPGPSQPQSKGVDLTGRSWGQIPTSKSAPGITGRAPLSKEDAFGDLLGGALGRPSGPLNQQTSASSGLHGVGKLKSSLPERHTETARQTPAAHAASSGRSSFAYTSMFNNPTPVGKPSPEPFSMGSQSKVDPFADLSFSKPSSAPIGASGPKVDPLASSGDPFVFASKMQTKTVPQSSRAASSRPAAFGKDASGGVDQFSPVFGSGRSSVSRAHEDPLESMLSRSQAPSTAKASTPVYDGWGDVFGGGGGGGANSNTFEDEGVTTELEGLGPPPMGVTGIAAYQKGNSFYKEGQFPNAIKWLSWALELLQKEGGNKDTVSDVITCRVSCYKEIGEYKKALADCTTACEMDEGSVEKLMQRAHLYESMEKYKLSVADLKKVLKLEPTHRMATLTLNRLRKMLD
ncbi:unnamed protein product [Sphagnum troendelagicum]|uniref:Uncharacterized protein n=1 Tax=Sphagnum troendelagicum TaxID=128251 RepID=A0ABP0UN00_9BRYO